jgi:hypothetical protein
LKNRRHDVAPPLLPCELYDSRTEEATVAGVIL